MAPGEADHPSIALVNSAGRVDSNSQDDLLGSPDETTAWMVDHDLAASDAEVQEYCGNRLRDFRDDVRSVLEAAVAGKAPPPDVLEAVNAAMRLTPALEMLSWVPGVGFGLQQDHPETRAVEHAMATVAADLRALLTGPDAPMLAVCADPSCGRFLLRTHARRHWCSKRCGDRIRAARAYARRTGRAEPVLP